ncbi:MAG: hypothetical protein HRO68_10250 [Nitrosopumilus sp.]|nr:hypothetical protein [Nitrosopumilus sp.]
MSVQDYEKIMIKLYEELHSKHFGKYKGIVQKTDDPESRGRITVKGPDVYDDKDSPWALPSVPFAGKNHGVVLIPEKDDGVWIEFEAGDPARPIWSGGWWASDELPEPGGEKTRLLATSKGHKIIIDDEKDEMKLLHSDGAEISLTKDEIVLKVGDTKIVLNRQEVNINNGALQVKQ